MDITKRNKLIEDLSTQPSPAVVPIERFFDGNDDVGSIGCNLPDHPGIEIFKAILVTLGRRGDVEAVYAQIAELDPGPDSWPFTDTIFVAGTIELDDFKALLKPLQPDEVGRGEHFSVPTVITDKHKTPVLVAWWD
jgi:hypothetical protein